MAVIRLKQTVIIDPGGGDVIRAFDNNNQRVFFVVSGRTVSNLFLCLTPEGFGFSQYWSFATGFVNQFFRRRDYGELITQDLYLTDLMPISPQCDIVITEGILIPGS